MMPLLGPGAAFPQFWEREAFACLGRHSATSSASVKPVAAGDAEDLATGAGSTAGGCDHPHSLPSRSVTIKAGAFQYVWTLGRHDSDSYSLLAVVGMAGGTVP